MIGQFNLDWHPAVATSQLDRRQALVSSAGSKRATAGKSSNASKAVDNAKRSYRYTLVAGVPASHYTGTIEVKPKGSGCVADWRVEFLANNQPDIVVRTMVSTLVKTGLGSLKPRFGAAA